MSKLIGKYFDLSKPVVKFIEAESARLTRQSGRLVPQRIIVENAIRAVIPMKPMGGK